jgi:hemoglobin-like flavoprotein
VTEWIDRFLNEPMAQNGWSLAALLLGATAVVSPLLVRMRRDRRVFRRRTKETTVSDQTRVEPAEDTARTVREQGMAEDDMAAAQPLQPAPDRSPDGKIDAEQEARWAAEGIPDTQTRLTGREASAEKPPFRGRMAVTSRQAPAPLVSPVRVECEHCKGVGYVPGINDLLVESASLIGDRGDEVVRLFYSTLLSDAPAMTYLFPSDIVSASAGTQNSKGVAQREKLLGALVALAENYHPGDPARMARLDRELQRFGRAHAGFVRPDGTTSGATLEEYAAVKAALFSTLVRVAAEKWKPEYAVAWSQAYDYATAIMLGEQLRSGFVAPRFPRS